MRERSEMVHVGLGPAVRAGTAYLAACAIIATPAFGQTPPRPLTLDDALATARTKNRDLLAAQTTIAQSDAVVDQAWAGLLPTLAGQAKYTHNYKEVALDLAAQNQALLGLSQVLKTDAPDSLRTALEQFEAQLTSGSPGAAVIQKQDQLEASLVATIPLVVPAAYGALSAAKHQRAATSANYETTLATILVRTAQTFFAAAGADEVLKVREHALQVARETLENSITRFATGVVNRVEVTRAELAVLRAEQAIVEAKDARDSVYRALAVTLALDEPFQVTAPADAGPASAAAASNVAALVRSARENRTEFRALQETIAANDAQSSAAAWRWAPTLSAFGNLRAFNYEGFSGDDYSWAVGAQLDWLFYDGGVRDAQRHLAGAQREENALKLAQLEATIDTEIKNAANASDTRRRALETSQRSVTLAGETLDLVRAQHDAGTATQLDLLQAQDALIASEVDVARARFDLQLAKITLERAAGIFPAPNAQKESTR